jgi:hypothetical protein
MTALACSFPPISATYSATTWLTYKVGTGLKEMPPESDVPSFSKHSDLGEYLKSIFFRYQRVHVLANVAAASTRRYSRQYLHFWAHITIYFYVFLGCNNKLPTNTTRTAVYVAATAKNSWLDALESTARAKAKDKERSGNEGPRS